MQRAGRVDLAEYESVRSEPTHFLVAPGHVWQPETERAVGEYETYVVVEKTGNAGDVALKRILVDRRLPVAAVRYAA